MSQQQQTKPTDKARTRGKSTAPDPGSPLHGKQQITEAVQAMDNSRIDQCLNRLEAIEANFTSLREIRETDVEHHKKHEDGLSKVITLLEESKRAHDHSKKELQITKHELRVAHERNMKLEQHVNSIENRMKECNLRIDGKREEENEDLTRFMMDMANQLKIRNPSPSDFVHMYRIGKKQAPQQARGNLGKVRTVMVQFASVQTRNKYFFARAALKDVDLFRGIYINDDITPMTRKQREEYRSVATLARNTGASVRVHSDGIVIDGHKYLLGEPQTLPKRFALEEAKMVRLNGELYFQSEYAYLSNFSAAPIVEDDVTYSTAEHMYQAHKCKAANDMKRMEQVILATTPLDAKKIAEMIPETQEWKNVRDEVMSKVVAAKFDQNPHLADMLLKTGDIKLNEATNNMHFGIGVNLHAREIKDKAYQGENKLGHILMKLREAIKTTRSNMRNNVDAVGAGTSTI